MRAIRRTDWRDPRACATRVTYQSGRIHIYAAAGERLPLIRMKRKWRCANLVIFAISSWPFGPALLVFRCGRYFGAVSVWVPSVYRWGWYLRSHRDCCSPACIWLRKTLSIPKHQAYQNIDYTKTSNVPKRQPHQSRERDRRHIYRLRGILEILIGDTRDHIEYLIFMPRTS